MAYPRYEFLDLSDKQRVFVVGDIHGEFKKLFDTLSDLGFDENTDVLISVGDLVDRGPHSDDFAIWINRPWFCRTLGNHDLQPREHLLGYEPAYNVSRNGGDWFLEKSREEQERIASILEDAPLALEVLTPGGRRVGITHADTWNRWATIKDNYQDPRQERNMVNTLTGSRKVIRKVQAWPDIDPAEVTVQEIDHVFHGHTPIDKVLTVGNRTWIDTGAFDGGPLTVLDIDQWIDNLSSK